jgi:glycosyltransferase involved in cell wall biosynthesis
MHILHYVRNFNNPLGGTERFVSALIQHLNKYDIQQSIITNSNDEEARMRQINNNNWVISLPSRTPGAYQILKGLSSVLRDSRYDIVNIHGYGEYAGDMLCILKELGFIHIPLVLTTHGSAGLKNGYLALDFAFPLTGTERISRLFHLFYDYTFGRLEMSSFDKIIISSEEEKEYLSKIGLKEKNLKNIPLAINEVFFGSKSNRTVRRYILYVGRIDRFKGIDMVVRAIKELRVSNIDVNCLIVGADVGYRVKLQLLIDRLGIGDIVEIRDPVSQDTLANVYSSGVVTVLASPSEGFPLALFESMASGTPFIATPVGVIPEIVNTSKAGMLVPRGDPKALARGISNLLRDQFLWSEMSRNGKDYAENFRWEKIARKFYDIYVELNQKV